MSVANLSEETKNRLNSEMKALYQRLLNDGMNVSEMNSCYREFKRIIEITQANRSFFGEGIESDIRAASKYKRPNLVYEHLNKAIGNMRQDIKDLYRRMFDEGIDS